MLDRPYLSHVTGQPVRLVKVTKISVPFDSLTRDAGCLISTNVLPVYINMSGNTEGVDVEKSGGRCATEAISEFWLV